MNLKNNFHAAYYPRLMLALLILVAQGGRNQAVAEPWDEDFSVAWIQRLPSLSYVWNSTNATREGWPAIGSNVTWRAMVKNWRPSPAAAVSYRWLVDGSVVSAGAVNLAAAGWTPVELVLPWSFARQELRFEIDSPGTVAEFSEGNNTLSIWTDAISLGLWVEQGVYDYFHQYQRLLGDGANGWEDWAQRQVARWNAIFAAAVDPIDAPQGVLDRIRLDKIVLVPNGALPLAGGLPTNHPDFNDRTVDLVWGFPATLLSGSFYADHTSRADWNAFYYEGSLIHELGHARYLIDTYGLNVTDSATDPKVLVRHAGQLIAGTPYLPRMAPWWDHVLVNSEGNLFDGLMSGAYTRMDRYSAAAMNRVAGRRAVLGNYNAPGNIGVFMNDLPTANRVLVLDGWGQPVVGATVSIYQASGHPEWYGKRFDDAVDAVFTADNLGVVNVGRNPFAAGLIEHTYGISNMVALVKAETPGRAGFAFLRAGLFNMEYWRGNTTEGHHALTFAMLGVTRELASVRSWPDGSGWRVQVIVSGDVQPQTVTVAGAATSYQQGAWWAYLPGGTGARLVSASWPGGPTVQRTVAVPSTLAVPTLSVLPVPGNSAQVQLLYPSRALHVYDFQRSPDLTQWTSIPGSRTHGTDAILSRTEVRSGPREFFRTIVRAIDN